MEFEVSSEASVGRETLVADLAHEGLGARPVGVDSHVGLGKRGQKHKKLHSGLIRNFQTPQPEIS